MIELPKHSIWTTRKAGVSALDFFSDELDDEDGTVIDVAATLTTAYIAYGTAEGIKCLVSETRWITQYALDEFYYSLHGEWQSPYPRNCPKRILDQLSPAEQLYTNEHQIRVANEWRESCRQRLEQAKKRPKVPQGAIVRFTPPLQTKSGQTLELLRYRKHSSFEAPDDRFTVWRVPAWRKRGYEVVELPA